MNAPAHHVEFARPAPGGVETVDTLLVLQHSDLQAILASRKIFDTKKLLFIDPGYFNDALQAGLTNVDFFHVDTGPDFQAQAFSEAISLATLLDVSLTRERARLWPKMTLTGWDVGVSFLALQRMIVARQLGSVSAEPASTSNWGF